MPVILEPGNEKSWLDSSTKPEDLNVMLKPFDEKKMTAYTVSRLLTKRDGSNNVPESQVEFKYPELGALF